MATGKRKTLEEHGWSMRWIIVGEIISLILGVLVGLCMASDPANNWPIIVLPVSFYGIGLWVCWSE